MNHTKRETNARLYSGHLDFIKVGCFRHQGTGNATIHRASSTDYNNDNNTKPTNHTTIPINFKIEPIQKLFITKEDSADTAKPTMTANIMTNNTEGNNSLKRSKPRRQSGDETAHITAETFRPCLLVRDDSVALLKHRTTNAIPMVVPLVLPQQEESTKGERPLRRIQRRNKPRRQSGDAVANKTRPIMVRDDSLLLTKKKLTGYGLVKLTTVEQEEGTAPQTTTAEKRATRPHQRQGKHGYVRQNSQTPPSA